MAELTTILNTDHTHVIFVQGDTNYPDPLFATNLKDANDKGKEIITKNPWAECMVFQIRTTLRGEINIIEKHFNQSAS